MIDTDKYEGHTHTKEWGDIVYADGYLPIFLNDGVYATDLDRELMTDAPLLLAEVIRLREQLTSADKMIREMIRESRDTPREAYVSGSAREAEQLFVHVLEANWDEVIE